MLLQVWLQEFAWTEEEKAAKLAQRGSVAGSISTSLQNEPMFCFGTAVKLFYWSHLVYDIKEVCCTCSASLAANSSNSCRSGPQTGYQLP